MTGEKTQGGGTEGFGNAFLETLYYRRPIVMNTYSVYTMDIKPKSFRVIEIDGYVTEKTVRAACAVLDDDERREAMVEENYRLCRKHFGYTVLRDRLRGLLSECLGR